MFSHKLFFVLTIFAPDFIHITFASNKTNSFILRDENNVVRDVEPRGLQEQLMPQTKVQVKEQFKELIDKGDYSGMAKLKESMSKKDFSEYLCSAMTNLGQYKNLLECLTNCDIIPDFLAHGNETLIKEAIVEFPINSSEHYIHLEYVNKAIIICLDENHHDRVFSLFEDVRARFVEEDRRLTREDLDYNFINFNFNFFIDYFRGRSNVSLKRFIAFHGEKLQREFPEIFGIFFVALLFSLVHRIYDADLQQFHDDLIGQSSPSMADMPAEGFLPGEINNFLQQPHIMGEWRDAVAIGLKGEQRRSGQHLWNVIMAKYPNEFHTKFPPSDDTLTAVLKKFKSKQELEDDWTKKNIPTLLERLGTIAFNLPTVLWNIVFEYATITWATTLSWETDSTDEIIEIESDITPERDPQQRQVIIHKREQFKELIKQWKYDEIIKLGDGMENREFMRCLCSSMTTLDHLRRLFTYLENRKILLTFLVYGNTTLVEEAIIEFSNPCSNFYINEKLLMKLITLFLDKATYDCVIEMLKIVKTRYTKRGTEMRQSEKDMFDAFMDNWFKYYSPEENSSPIKHFLTLHGQDFVMKYPDIFDTFCERFVNYLRFRLPYPKAATLLTDLVAQRSLLTPTTFASGFLTIDYDDRIRLNFFIHGWREAVEEGLKQECSGGGEQLWGVMARNFPERFTGAYPNTDELRAIACAKIKTKKEIENEWIEKNMLIPLKHFEDVAAFLPNASMTIIYEYLTFTWIIC